MKKHFVLFLLIVKHLVSAQSGYIGELQMADNRLTLRFNTLVHETKKGVTLKIINVHDTISLIGQPMPNKKDWRFDFPIFNTHIRLRKVIKMWVGYFQDDDKGDKVGLILSPSPATHPRYTVPNAAKAEERFQIFFEPGTPNERVAILEYFSFHDREVRGSVLTAAGDYRFLQGSASADSVVLSTFDGKFAYVFAGRINGDSITGYQFFTKGTPKPFAGVRRKDASLPDPKTLTRIKDSADNIRFSLSDTEGSIVHFDAANPGAKLTFITIGGSWCPNCMDEARYLNRLYSRYKDKGLQIIGVYFEYSDKETVALPILKRMREQLGLDFPILFGGSVRLQAAAQVFPQIQKVLAYPTLIALDANGKIIKTYTGFYGPGTSLFADYEREMAEWITLHLK